ncbi:MAG: AtpZ/AtpI family protein [Pseudomonadota bacterium]|nr:AtpZ/AtpI family protein [Pseudomonadota bacterium]
MATFDEENKKTERALIKKAHKMAERDNRTLSFNAAILTVYGWQIAIPTFIGVLLGGFLDRHVPIPYLSWTLNLLLIGIAIGFYNANAWVKKEGLLQKKEKHKK